MTAQRRNDASLTLCQNNATRSIRVVKANGAAESFLGAPLGGLTNTPFYDLLGARSAEYFADMVDFEPDGVDVLEASQKLRDLRFKHPSGNEMTTPFRLERIDSPDGHGWFELVLPSHDRREVRELLGQYVRQHFAGAATLHPETGLPCGDAAEAYAQMLKNTLPGHGMEGCCALLRLDRYGKSLARYGKAGVIEQLKHVANCCKSTFREEDIICQMNDYTLAMFLVDIDHDAARIVLNRLRWNIRNHRIAFGGREDFSVTVSIVFGSLLSPGDSALTRCRETLAAMGEDERNALAEVGAV